MMDVVTRILSIFMIAALPGGYTKTPEKVVGGKDARKWEFPYHVSLREKGEHFCGGSIIDQFHVLTAASCVVLEPGVFRANIEVLSGTIDAFDISRGNLRSVSHMTIHEDYDPANFWINDIAVLTLTRPIIFSPWCGSIPPINNLHEKLDELIAVGWGGNIFPTTTTLRFLQKIKVRPLDRLRCDSWFGNFQDPHPNQGCIQIRQHRIFGAISKGDGGGPVIVLPRHRILGIISISNTEMWTPTIYTKVYPYKQWIIDATVY